MPPAAAGLALPGALPIRGLEGTPMPNPEGNRLTLALLVRDDVEGVAAAIKSAARFADEVVVRDTGSRDGTPEAAAALGARVVRGRFRDDFAEARNSLLDACSGDWVLMLDADERVIDGGDRIAALLLDPRASAYAVEIESAVGFGKTVCQAQVRLFRRLASVRFVHRVHETLTVKRVRRAPLRIEHSGFLPSRRYAKCLRDLALLDRELGDAPDDAYLHWRRSLDLSLLGREDEATFAMERMAALVSPLDATQLSRLEWVPEAVSDWAEAAADRGEARRALGLATRVALAHPDRPLARYAHARALAAAGRASDAARAARSLLEDRGWHYESPLEGQVLREHAPALLAALGAS